mgnify:CR=1 FL=1
MLVRFRQHHADYRVDTSTAKTRDGYHAISEENLEIAGNEDPTSRQ